MRNAECGMAARFIDAAPSKAQQVAGGDGDAAGGGPMGGPEVWVIRHRSVFGVETLRRRIEQAKAFTGYTGYHLRRYPSPWPRFPHAKQAACARHRSNDRISI